ncbi:phosphoribosyl-AMP cyclohydrolase [bacterium]|nr:phosphoribosyl-AMP cyclohydrolase [bacterium]
MKNRDIISQIKFDKKGLVVAIVQDDKGEVLMVAYMNSEALIKTIETRRMHYYSRSRKKLWLKGEESGNFQVLKDIYIDCDNDALLFVIEQKGGACHKGYYSCFFRKLQKEDDSFCEVEDKIFNPKEVYKK